MQTLTFTGTSSTVSTGGQKIEAAYNEVNTGSTAQGIVGIKCFARCTNASNTTFTMHMALRRNVDGVIIERRVGTITATTNRSGDANGSGEYICTTSWASSNSEFFDVGGGTEPQQGGLVSTGYSWYMLCVTNAAGTLNTANPLIVEVHPIRTV